MTREELATASDLLASIETSGETAQRLEDLAEQIAKLSEADRGPDHGRLARWQNALNDIKGDVDDDATATIDKALEAIVDYRSTVEGV